MDKPISLANDGNQKNEIFVDIYEKINITFNSSGVVLNSDIDGMITMKSYLAGNPPLKLALNEELLIGKKGGSNSLSVVCLDDCNFHECVNLDEFDKFRVLNILPPDGEFTVMNYRITSEFRAPFRIFPLVEMINPNKVELVIKVRADIPEQNYGSNVTIQFPVPKGTSGYFYQFDFVLFPGFLLIWGWVLLVNQQSTTLVKEKLNGKLKSSQVELSMYFGQRFY